MVMMQKRAVLSLILIGVVSFILHFIWEWFQCGPFFIHRGAQATPISMVTTALGDVVLTFFIIGLAPLLGRFERSLEALKKSRGLIFIQIIAFVTAIAVEKFALATNRWDYTEINPLLPLFNVSTLPILQLMLLTPAVVVMSLLLMKFISEKNYLLLK